MLKFCYVLYLVIMTLIRVEYIVKETWVQIFIFASMRLVIDKTYDSGQYFKSSTFIRVKDLSTFISTCKQRP